MVSRNPVSKTKRQDVRAANKAVAANRAVNKAANKTANLSPNDRNPPATAGGFLFLDPADV